MINVTKATLPALDEYVDEIKKIWDSHWLTNMGEEHKKFEKKLMEYMNVPCVELFTNGHMALELSLQALGLRGEVITTPFTFASTTHAIIRNGLTPVFCDIHPDAFTMDEDKIESLITEKTCAIVPVHVYGNICNIKKIQEIARKYNLKVVYDAAHAFGEVYEGSSVGDYGDVSCFSLHATKVFNSIEGGIACYHDKVFGDKLSGLKNFGIRGPEMVDMIGSNAKMNEFCAAMGICNLTHFEENVQKRKKVYELYLRELEGTTGISINYVDECCMPNYAYFPIIVDADLYGANRDELADYLFSNGVFARKYFYPLTSDFECYRDTFDSGLTPIARKVSQEVLTLPMHPYLQENEVIFICDMIKRGVKNNE